MQILAGKAMERRTFLRGLGATLALPYLDAMEPAVRSLRKFGGASAATEKTRLVCMELVHGSLSLTVAERRIAVVHDPREIDARLAANHDLVLHGHTHRLTLERRDGTLIFNPGECAGFLPGHNAVGVADLAKLELELLRF